MTLNRQIAAAVALALVAVAAQADPWKGKGEAGAVWASGNTDSSSVNLKLSMTKEVEEWKHALDMSYLRASSNGDTSANKFVGGWQSNYNFSARTFAFGALRYEHDEFSGFDYQASASTGMGYKFYDTDTLKLSGQAGLGYRRIKDNVSGATSGDLIFVAGLNYEYAVTSTTKLVDKFHMEAGSDNTLLTNFAGVEVKMSDKLALSAGYDVTYNTDPPAGPPGTTYKKTDTVTTLNLVYSF
jgi:putative salt-induced outer membrane protein